MFLESTTFCIILPTADNSSVFCMAYRVVLNICDVITCTDFKVIYIDFHSIV